MRSVIVEIQPLDEAAMTAARDRQPSSSSLRAASGAGGPRDLARGVTGEAAAVRARIVVAAADHGVAAEGVSAFRPRSPHRCSRPSCPAAARSTLGAGDRRDLICVDAGVERQHHAPRRRPHRLEAEREPRDRAALSPDDVRHAIKVGMKLAATAKTDGLTILAAARWASATRRRRLRSRAG